MHLSELPDVYVCDKMIHEVTAMTITEAHEFFTQATFDAESTSGRRILKEIQDRLHFLISVGLDYLV